MADAIVSELVRTVLGQLNSVALQEIGNSWGLANELNNLESMFTTIQLVLQEAEVKQRKSKVIQNWLKKLKNSAYDVENILDQIATEGLLRKMNSEKGIHYQLNAFLSIRNPLLFRLKTARKVKKIREKLNSIAEERLKFHLRECNVNYQVRDVESRKTFSLVNELEIYGRHEEKEMIVENLVDKMSDQDELSVSAVCGMGGIGKTTLAQLIYNDERVKKHFELRIWVCVSDDFSIQRLLRAILESIGDGCNISEPDPLLSLLQEKLTERRFLLVLDDVWNENHRQWDWLKEALRCGSKGSVVMITTRIEKVALMMATTTIHHLECLSEDDSWSLFKQRAFTTGEGEETLVAIGKTLVKKCGGVPLAVKALGSLMRFKSCESEWLAIKESEMWHLSDDESGILPALMLSYDNLSPQMRQCFVYCCIFPKDYVMENTRLIQLWMANGFLNSEAQTDLHLTGNLIFKELTWRSFFQDVQKNFRGGMTCKMHDLIHDLAGSIMRHEAYILEHHGKVPEIPKTLRHLTFDLRSSWEIFEDKGKLKLPNADSLRSLILHGRELPALKKSFLSKQQYLRVLDSNCYIIEKLPKFVCKLENLRFLGMSCYNLKRLPESLTRLQNLQTLKLTASENLLELPKGLKNMKNLWFVDIENCCSLFCTPPGLGSLTCLQRLSIFIVSQDTAHQIDQLKELNLGGELIIKGLEHVRNLQEAQSAKLMTKKNLTSLSLAWTNGIKENSAGYFEEVLKGIQPHQNLEKICIKSYQGSRFPNWLSDIAFKNLTEIFLDSCQRCEHLPPLGKLTSLKCLKLYRLDAIRTLNSEWHGDGESSFAALTDLTISRMPNLEEWTIADSRECFPCLVTLHIKCCPKLVGLPFLPTLKSLYVDISVTFLRSIMLFTSLTSLGLYDSYGQIDVLHGGFLSAHKDLRFLQIIFPNLRTLSNMLDNLSCLKTLNLCGCSNLESPPDGLKHLNSLEKLEFMSCDSLASFPATILEKLSSLRSLSFQNCKKLVPLLGPLQRVTALQYLLINGCPELKCLPESIEQLSALRELSIMHCEGLCSLPNWLGNLQSLSVMKIWYSKNLNSLPDGFRSLKSLRKLEIKGCHPHLEKRCKKPKGEDWPKISHIPQIHINSKTIQYLGV